MAGANGCCWPAPQLRPWLTVAALTVSITGPVVLLVWFVTGLVFQGEVYSLRSLPLMIVPVAVITATMSAINVFLAKAQPIQTHAAPIGAAPARFPDRLPMKLRGASIRAVQAEDHYLRIHTDRGSDLILMRLSDAVIEMEGLEGAQVHRMAWPDDFAAARNAALACSTADWNLILDEDERRLGNVQLSQTAINFFGRKTLAEVRNVKSTIDEIVNLWMRQPGGFADMLSTGHILFGINE